MAVRPRRRLELRRPQGAPVWCIGPRAFRIVFGSPEPSRFLLVPLFVQTWIGGEPLCVRYTDARLNYDLVHAYATGHFVLDRDGVLLRDDASLLLATVLAVMLLRLAGSTAAERWTFSGSVLVFALAFLRAFSLGVGDEK